MARDDQRMHGGNTPGLVPGRGHERHEEPVDLRGPEPGSDRSVPDGAANLGETAGSPSSTEERDQPSALGGKVATRSGTGQTPPDERA